MHGVHKKHTKHYNNPHKTTTSDANSKITLKLEEQHNIYVWLVNEIQSHDYLQFIKFEHNIEEKTP